ncbi:MAG: prolyl oligopeptidase family serine peptidase [Gemmatimonadota bacterium]|nr:prolyl oligopeptidase family serine peptidase [Gemmatimonadota bacterium]MDH5196010.1 prolyl oligopeptidase family serine peptidase [Gemmatimonadota bacterium]
MSAYTRLTPIVLLGILPALLEAQRPLDHDAYDRWRTIEQEALSRDGQWVVYVLEPQQGDAELVVRATRATTEYRVARGRDPRFAPRGGHVVFTIKPEYAAVRAAKVAKKRGDDLPKDSLGILDLTTGEVVRVEQVKSFKVPERDGESVAYLVDRPKEEKKGNGRDTTAAQPDSTAPKAKKDSEVGSPLVVRHLASGVERRYDDVMEYEFSRDGARLATAVSSRDGAADGVLVLELAEEPADHQIAGGRGVYRSLAFAEAGDRLAFLTTRDDAQAAHPRFALYAWQLGETGARLAAQAGSTGVPEGWSVSEHRAPSFSRNGGRLYFGTAPWEAPPPEDSTPDDERVPVDIWHWQDAELQPMQLRRANQERRRNYLAVADLVGSRIVQLADTALPSIDLPDGGDGAFGLGTDDRAYRIRISWDTPGWQDVYAVDLATGGRTLLLRETQARAELSAGGTYAAWYDVATRTGVTYHLATGRTATVTTGIPYPLEDEENDSPTPARTYGIAGWTDGDGEVLIYDRYDVWALDPAGGRAPRNLTDGVGRRDSVRFRVVDLDREREAMAAGEPLLLSAFDYRTKAAGFYRDRVTGDRAPERLLWMDRRFSTPRKAEAADMLLFTRESLAEFPNLWVAEADLGRAAQISDANPQQAEYRWATVELVHWRAADGAPLAGLLYKPVDFDSTKQYPMIVNFYERNSDNLHAHSPAIPHRSTIRPSFYASRGYLVFIPDVVYKIGYPGQSAVDCVVPGVLELIERGFVDPKHIGLQGHSWGGYQIAYMVTKTNLFAAGAPGAPVANMTSAYGGIRWESGMSRMFQYERTQSRLGASLWEVPLRYLENSPLFWIDRVETPLLILHNDNDGAVPWYQGIELFTAMRRLGKPAWLVNYNGEPHWPLPYPKRRDWNIRMQQFFDHYLKGAPAPRWLAEGVPATEKGTTLGLETEWDR